MMKKMIVLSLFVVIFSGCATTNTTITTTTNSRYYDTAWPAEEIERAIDSVVIVKTKFGIKDKGMRQTRAIGLYVGGDMVLALSHATVAPVTVTTEFGPITVVVSTVLTSAEKFYIGNEEIELIGRYEDISLFKFLTNKPVPIFGDYDNIKIGDRVIDIGYSFSRGINIKEGIVSQFDLKLADHKWLKAENLYMVTLPINPGDSGSQVLAYHNGKLELVGIVQGACDGEAMGYILRTDYIKETIEKIKRGETKIIK